MKLRSLLTAACAAASLLWGGCSAPSGATCPSDSSLTYENFAQPFMQSYCVRCHGQSVSGTARQGAPASINLDTLADVRAHVNDIDLEAAAGPGGTNTSMPQGNPKPTDDERRKLGEWLACGAP